jgi:glycine oxidase
VAKGADVIIIGAGIIGLSVAWRLAKAGVSALVLEQGQVGTQASGAAAGMLAPLSEADKPGPFVELGIASLRMYPDFVAALKEESGLQTECVSPGLLRVAVCEEEAKTLQTANQWQQATGLKVVLLSAEEVRKIEPGLSMHILAATLSPDEKQYESPRLVRALALACARRGVQIMENAQVTGFQTSEDCVKQVRTLTNAWEGDSVVIAGGAWSKAIGDWLGLKLPVTPIRGQILSLRALPPPIRYTVYSHMGYLVPRPDGRIVVGATAEEAGFDVRPTASGIAHLLTMAPLLVPSLKEAVFDSVWAGLRPKTPDNLPILGPLPGWRNVHAACGHYRNGILLAPITGELVAHGILTHQAHPMLEPFRADRFQ